MNHRPLLGLLGAAAMLTACGAPPSESAPPDDHPCQSAWALEGADAFLVDPASITDAAMDAGALDLNNAIADALLAGSTTVALGAGEFSAAAETRRLHFTAAQSGITVLGCGPEQTVINAIDAAWQGAPAGTPEERQSVIEVDAGAQGITIRGLTARGGRSALFVHDGAGSVDPIVFEDVVVEDSVRAGLLFGGLDSNVRALDVTVDGVTPDGEGQHGWGVAVLGGGTVFNEPEGVFEFVGLDVSGATGAGVVVDHAHATFEGSSVSDTEASGGVLGRGFQIQNNSSATLDGVTASGNTDAGVFLHKPVEVTIRDSEFSSTVRGSVPGDPEAITGDGLVASAGSEPDDPPVDAAERRVTIETSSFVDNGRAGVLIEGVTAVLGPDVTFEGNGLAADTETFPLGPDIDTAYFQGEGVVNGIEGQELGGESGLDALQVHRDDLGLDD